MSHSKSKQHTHAHAAHASKADVTRLQRINAQARIAWDYCNGGVWQDSRNSWWVKLVKVVNLSMRCFTSVNLQNRACAMTYRTILALVPMLALLFAIGRGFGLQDLLEHELYNYFPSQRTALEMAFRFVDSYLSQASGGIFVGIGILFLLWTLISLLSSLEDIFNSIWNVKSTRTFWRKITDYTAILLILPILMICSSGITIFMSTTLQALMPFDVLTPVLSHTLDAMSLILTWLFFAGSFTLIPNAKVKFTNALVAGIIAGTGFIVLQWLFVTGQLYVSKYNAIYGSFSFLPLMLIWLQLVWLITFIGATICYSSQNIFRFSMESNINKISIDYRLEVALAILAVIVKRFQQGETPLTAKDFVELYNMPPRLVDESLSQLKQAGMICHVASSDPDDDLADLGLVPTRDPAAYRLADSMRQLREMGKSNFIAGFDTTFANLSAQMKLIFNHLRECTGNVALTTLASDPPKAQTATNHPITSKTTI